MAKLSYSNKSAEQQLPTVNSFWSSHIVLRWTNYFTNWSFNSELLQELKQQALICGLPSPSNNMYLTLFPLTISDYTCTRFTLVFVNPKQNHRPCPQHLTLPIFSLHSFHCTTKKSPEKRNTTPPNATSSKSMGQTKKS